MNLEFAAGLLIRGQVRGSLKALKMYGHISDFTEAKGLLRSVFYVKDADSSAVETFNAWDEWSKERS